MIDVKTLNVLSEGETRGVSFHGRTGFLLERAMSRLHDKKFNYKFLAADLDFNQERWFTNYSGDVSGRFIEVMSLASNGDIDYHEALKLILLDIPRLQRKLGNFGIDIDWSQPIDYEKDSTSATPRMMPILWGNGRIFPGLIEAYLVFGQQEILDTAKRLGDFYLNTNQDLCNKDRVEEYHATGSYAAGYTTCYFIATEGLVRLYQVTKEEKYLEQAERMADFRQKYGFDTLPVEHTHGYLCNLYGIALLYQVTKNEKWLQQLVSSWDILTQEGYVDPSGGLLEKGIKGYNRDEGCSVADWLRLNFLLYHLTGDNRYINMADRTLHNHLRINQCDTGGFGHRLVLSDEIGPTGYGKYHEEALWCCDFHGAMSLLNLRKYVVLYKEQQVLIPLAIDFNLETPFASINQTRVCGNKESQNADSGNIIQQWNLTITPNESSGIQLVIRTPEWSKGIKIYNSCGDQMECYEKDNYVYCKETIDVKTEFVINYMGDIITEDRFFHQIDLDNTDDKSDIVLRKGPDLLTYDKNKMESFIKPQIIEDYNDDSEIIYVFKKNEVVLE